jgi:hypothetical protein
MDKDDNFAFGTYQHWIVKSRKIWSRNNDLSSYVNLRRGVNVNNGISHLLNQSSGIKINLPPRSLLKNYPYYYYYHHHFKLKVSEELDYVVC